ncbi:GT-D fold domain-containing glycosyltransferase [Actinoplanes sp. RD1]|uniref:GT-D fold domain-containing glycosyltransferase n=1 Tax=Actinoplanes sp. RD1 TaxID=3064538 RepID=UPI002740C1BD|nr:GT-D fold domain-containing glycosyltransferase [Actinoplanes sp. RD1]
MTNAWRRTKGLIKRRLEPPKPDPRVLKAVQETNSLLYDIRWELKEQRKYLEGFRAFASTAMFAEIREFTEAQQLGFEETMRRVAHDRLSLARFGDGELKIMLRPQYNLRFQPWSAGLAGDLRAVLGMDGYDPERLLVGFPYTFRDAHWTSVWLDIWPEVKPLLNPHVQYGTAHVSRPIYFSHLGNRGAQLWRDVWDGQQVVIVTGEGSRFHLEPQLFGNAKSIDFVYSAARDAYADLPRLMAELDQHDPDRLYLLALGPCGTLVAAWLSQRGRWAVDMGHISESWANVFAGGAWPEALEVVRK